MAIGFPVKADYATGDVLTAANMNDLGGTLNTVPSTIGAYAAGKNKIINGDFRFNQRNFTSDTFTGYKFDRWVGVVTAGGGTVTFSAQAFTLGAAPVAGYEGTNFFRCLTSGQVNTDARAVFRQNIESVRTFAGQTVTVSFWAKAGSGTPSLNVELNQVFGTGGSPSAEISVVATKQSITTSWVRYSYTLAVPSISGKTIGTAGDDLLRLNIWASAGSTWNTPSGTLGIQNNTFDIWGVQVEAGSIATPFQTATGTIQGELAACQRYYWRQTAAGNAYSKFGLGVGNGATDYQMSITNPVAMRVPPTSVDSSNLAVLDGIAIIAVSAVALNAPTNLIGGITATGTGFTAGRGGTLIANNNTAAFIGFSAEL